MRSGMPGCSAAFTSAPHAWMDRPWDAESPAMFWNIRCNESTELEIKEANVMNNKFDELTKGLAQSVTRRGALKKFGVGLAELAPGFLRFALVLLALLITC